MNARGARTQDLTWQALTARSDHAGHVRDLSLPQLARRVGVTQRHMQTVMAALEAAGRFTRDVRRGFTNRYRLLAAWTHAMIAGEARAAGGNAAASEPAPGAASVPPPAHSVGNPRSSPGHMSAEDAFLEALAAEREGGSNFRLALDAVGGSTRTLAEELNVSQRTVQRWRNYDEGTGKQSRNPETSAKASDLKAMADTEREQRALDRMAEATGFSADIEVDYVASGNPQDEGSRNAYGRDPLNMRPAVQLYRDGKPMSEVGAALREAIADSYILPAGVNVRDVSSLSLH